MSKSKQHKRRGGLLTFAIILIIVANLILAAAIHSMKGMLAPDAPTFLIWLTWISALGGALMWFRMKRRVGVGHDYGATVAIVHCSLHCQASHEAV